MKTLLAFVLLLPACAWAPVPEVDIPPGMGWCCGADDPSQACSRCDAPDARPMQPTAWCFAAPDAADAYVTRCIATPGTCGQIRDDSGPGASMCFETD